MQGASSPRPNPGLICLLALSGLLSFSGTASAQAAGSLREQVLAGIRQAGKAEDDTVRLELLRKLAAMPGLDPAVKADPEKLVRIVDRWLPDRSLCAWFSGDVIRRCDFDFDIASASPLFPLTCLLSHAWLQSLNMWLESLPSFL